MDFILFHVCTPHHEAPIYNLFSHYCIGINSINPRSFQLKILLFSFFPMFATCLYTYPNNSMQATTVDMPHVIMSCNYMADSQMEILC